MLVWMANFSFKMSGVVKKGLVVLGPKAEENRLMLVFEAGKGWSPSSFNEFAQWLEEADEFKSSIKPSGENVVGLCIEGSKHTLYDASPEVRALVKLLLDSFTRQLRDLTIHANGLRPCRSLVLSHMFAS